MDTNNTSTVLLSWSAPERLPVNRGTTWYAVLGLCIIAGSVYSILTGAWILSIVIVMSSALYVYHLRQGIAARSIVIREGGYSIDETFTSWHDCSGFWIYQHGSHYTLHIEKLRGINREDILVFSDLDYRTIAEVVNAFVPYRSTRRENLLDSIIRICKL